MPASTSWWGGVAQSSGGLRQTEKQDVIKKVRMGAGSLAEASRPLCLPHRWGPPPWTSPTVTLSFPLLPLERLLLSALYL